MSKAEMRVIGRPVGDMLIAEVGGGCTRNGYASVQARSQASTLMTEVA